MKLIIFLVIMILVGTASALSIQPSTDILIKNSDGEYVEIFGPGNFYFADGQFPNPVQIVNGTAVIGGATYGKR